MTSRSRLARPGSTRDQTAPVSKAFLVALADSFAELGSGALRAFRDDDPAGYVRTLAEYMPEGATLADILSDDR